jgi:cell division protein FtsL
MAEHEHGKMDITEQEKTFEGFVKVIAITCVVVAIILIFLALVNA